MLFSNRFFFSYPHPNYKTYLSIHIEDPVFSSCRNTTSWTIFYIQRQMASAIWTASSHRDHNTNKIITLSYQFFQDFRREKYNQCLKHNNNLRTVKSYNGPLRTDHIRVHRADQDSERWATYSELFELKNRDYFKVGVLFTENLLAYFCSTAERITELISHKIFEDIIEDLLEVRTSVDADWPYRQFYNEKIVINATFYVVSNLTLLSARLCINYHFDKCRYISKIYDPRWFLHLWVACAKWMCWCMFRDS